LEFTDSGEDGLSFWADPAAGNGFFRFRSLAGATLRTFEPEFGHRIKAAFAIGTITSMNELPLPGTLEVWPNPSAGEFTITAQGIDGEQRLDILDATGRLLRTERVRFRAGGSHLLDLTQEQPGIYFLRLTHESGTVLLRIVKQ
jgi:hypothetical protein